MKRLIPNILLVALIILFSGCELNEVSLPSSKPIIDENLAMIDSSTVKTISDLNSIALEWKGVTSPEIKGYHIYRSKISENGESLARIYTIDSKYSTHYLDTNLQPDTQYMYAIATKGKNNTESPASQSVETSTKIRFPSVSFISALSDLPRQIKILWRPHSNSRVSKYIIQRSDTKTSKWKNIKTINKRLIVEHIDEDIGDNVEYSYRIQAVTFDGIESLPSDIATATTKPLPNGIDGLIVTTTEPKKIILTWKPPTSTEARYLKIYSNSSQHGSFKLISNAKLTDNTYVDNINEDGKQMFYKVTVVDKLDLESSILVAPTRGSTLEIPAHPMITLSMIEDDKVVINWKPSDDRTIKYNIYKIIKTNFFSKKEEKIENITDTRFEDKNIVRGIKYEYQIEAIDQFGLVSKKTSATTLILPDLDKVKEINATPTSK